MIQYNRTQPLTTVRSPVRGASDSVSRHDGPHQQGGTERPAQHGSVKAREASTLGGYQGHKHTHPQQLNQTHQNTDSHHISVPPSRHITPLQHGFLQNLRLVRVPHQKYPPYFTNHTNQSPIHYHTDYAITPRYCWGVGLLVNQAPTVWLSCLDRRGEYP